MMCAVRRLLLPLVVSAALGAVLGMPLVGGAPGVAAADAATAPGPAVHTLVGPGALDAPAGLALDSSGDLFVADSGHCRIAVVPSRSSSFDGQRLRPGRATTLVGGSCHGPRSIGHPTGLAVDAKGDVFIAEATAQRVQVVRPGTHPTAVTVAGTGRAGFSGNGQPAVDSELDQPTAVAVDGSGDLFIADTANCLVRAVPAQNTTLFGVAMTVGGLYTVAGVRVCGSAGQGGPTPAAELWNPVAVALDGAGDLVVADRGDQSVLVAAAHGGTFWGTAVESGHIGVVVGGTGSYGPYLADGLSATGGTAELNDPRGLAVGPTGVLYVTDGFMHAVRAVPSSDGTLFGRSVKGGDLYTLAGAVPVSTGGAAGNGTHWTLTHVDTPSGIVVSGSGNVVFDDAALGSVSMVAGP